MPMNPDPNRCKAEAGIFIPVINRNKCEAKGPCVPACPYGVLAILPLAPEEKTGMSLLGKLKAMAHGGRQAHVVKEADCRACGYCVEVCPEKAITLKRKP
jgi:NAD-dependent dihydropyrimidine dehydrogenase PreA subunit